MIKTSDDKVFVFEKQGSNQTEMVKWPIHQGIQNVNIENILDSITDLNKETIKIYDAETNQYLALDQICFKPFEIPIKYLSLNYVLIKYSRSQENDSEENIDNLSSEQHKKERSRERTIKQVIEMVHQWRELNSKEMGHKKMNLQEAAKKVGISKKSLDDYYYQLRIGEKHSFDFYGHLDDKIGFLRAFIKQKEPEKRGGKQKNAKHAKKLKIIEDFDAKLNINEIQSPKVENKLFKNQSMNSQRSKIIPDFELSNQSGQLFWGIPFGNVNEEAMKGYEQNFLKQFDYDIDESNDPLIDFAGGNLKDESPSNLFF